MKKRFHVRRIKIRKTPIRASIVVSIPACHAGDRSSILRLGEGFILCAIFEFFLSIKRIYIYNLLFTHLY